jgi:hypothetical protein
MDAVSIAMAKRVKKEAANKLYSRPGQARKANNSGGNSPVISHSTGSNGRSAASRVLMNGRKISRLNDCTDTTSSETSEISDSSTVQVEPDEYGDYTLLIKENKRKSLSLITLILVILFVITYKYCGFRVRVIETFMALVTTYLVYSGLKSFGMDLTPVFNMGFSMSFDKGFYVDPIDFPELGTLGSNKTVNMRMLNDLHRLGGLNDFGRTRDNYGICKSIIDSCHKIKPYTDAFGTELNYLQLSQLSSVVSSCFLQQIYITRKKFGNKTVDSDMFRQLSN